MAQQPVNDNNTEQSVMENVIDSDGVTVTKYENKMKIKTIWVLIKGYTERRKFILNADRKKGPNKPKPQKIYKGTSNEISPTSTKSNDSIPTNDNDNNDEIEQINNNDINIDIDVDPEQLQINKSSPYYLKELKHDINRVQEKIKNEEDHHLYIMIEINHQNENFGKNELKKLIQGACNYTCQYGERLIIYYTGHGQTDRGDWILNSKAKMTSTTNVLAKDEQKESVDDHDDDQNSVISLEDVFNSISCIFTSKTKKEARILADCCYSNKWVTGIADFKDDEILHESLSELHIYGSAHPSTGGAEDGKFSPWLIGKTEVGICYHGRVDKDGGWIKLWVDSEIKEIHRSLSGTNLFEGVNMNDADQTQPNDDNMANNDMKSKENENEQQMEIEKNPQQEIFENDNKDKNDNGEDEEETDSQK